MLIWVFGGLGYPLDWIKLAEACVCYMALAVQELNAIS